MKIIGTTIAGIMVGRFVEDTLFLAEVAADAATGFVG
jgi:hypothetical protein